MVAFWKDTTMQVVKKGYCVAWSCHTWNHVIRPRWRGCASGLKLRERPCLELIWGNGGITQPHEQHL